MSRHRTLAFFLSLSIGLFPLCSSAEPTPESEGWTLESSVDSMTDREIRIAIGRNTAGYQLKIYRNGAGRAYGTFVLPDDFVGSLDSEKAPMFRVDKLEPVQINSNRALDELTGFAASETKPSWVHFVVWHGEGTQVFAGTLRSLMDGEKVVFRYFLFTGGYRETAFELRGAKEVIAEALGVEAEVDGELQAAEKPYREATIAVTNECSGLLPNRRKFAKCIDRYLECSKRTPKTAAILNKCFYGSE